MYPSQKKTLPVTNQIAIRIFQPCMNNVVLLKILVSDYIKEMLTFLL